MDYLFCDISCMNMFLSRVNCVALSNLIAGDEDGEGGQE